MDIKADTVFSGAPAGYSHGIFYKCKDGCVRLAYSNGGKCDGYVVSNSNSVGNYKELNAYLCIEE